MKGPSRRLQVSSRGRSPQELAGPLESPTDTSSDLATSSDADPPSRRLSIDRSPYSAHWKISPQRRPGGSSGGVDGAYIGRARMAGQDGAMYSRSGPVGKARILRPSMEARRKKLDFSALQVYSRRIMIVTRTGRLWKGGYISYRVPTCGDGISIAIGWQISLWLYRGRKNFP